MRNGSAIIKKGSILVYRLFDIAHEINLSSAQSILTSQGKVKRYTLKQNVTRPITIRDAPIVFETDVDKENNLILMGDKKVTVTSESVKLWDYGVLSICYQIPIPEGISWLELTTLAKELEINSNIDTISLSKCLELADIIKSSLKTPHLQSTSEDYTVYVLEDLNPKEKTTQNKEKELTTIQEKVKIEDILKKYPIAELLLSEPTKKLSEQTQKQTTQSLIQYSNKDLLVMDWNTALIVDLSEDKEYQDYVDIIEFSLSQLLELRIYDGLLDDRLNQLYDSMENKHFNKITEFYSNISDESSSLYMEFSDVFERIDNSIKTAGDFYLSRVIKLADRKFGFDELKRNMSRKIESLSRISEMCQEKVDSLVVENKNFIQEKNHIISRRIEVIILILFIIETIPVFAKVLDKIYKILN